MFVFLPFYSIKFLLSFSSLTHFSVYACQFCFEVKIDALAVYSTKRSSNDTHFLLQLVMIKMTDNLYLIKIRLLLLDY